MNKLKKIKYFDIIRTLKGEYMKKLSILIILLFLAIGLVSCNNEKEPITPVEEPQDNPTVVEKTAIEKVIEAIDNISLEITEDDFSKIDEANNLYEKLSSEEKEEVTNYRRLVDALDTKDMLTNEEAILEREANEIAQMIDDILPSFVDLSVRAIDLIDGYTFRHPLRNHVFKVDYKSTNNYYMNEHGVCLHDFSEGAVTMTAKIYCLKPSYVKEFTKEITIEARNAIERKEHKLVAYWYGSFNGLREQDKNSLDIINFSFCQIAAKTDKSGNNIYYLDTSELNQTINNFAKVHEYGIKACLSIGGWHDDSSFWNTYSDAAKTEAGRKQVAQSILEVLETYHLDGIDMDWEYPKSTDKTNFTLLMKEISDTLKAKNPEYLITMAVPTGSWITQRYDVIALGEFLDYIYLMTYDLDLDGSVVAKCHTNLNSCISAVTQFTNYGIPKEKLIIGGAFYGREFKLNDATNHGLNQPYVYKNTVFYQHIRDTYLTRLGQDVTEYEDSNGGHYLFDSTNNIFVSCDTPTSITLKWQYAVSSDIGGMMYWSYQDDKTGDLMSVLDDLINNKNIK